MWETGPVQVDDNVAVCVLVCVNDGDCVLVCDGVCEAVCVPEIVCVLEADHVLEGDDDGVSVAVTVGV